MADKLTPKQEAYVQGLFKGLSQREAYKQAGYSTQNMTDNSLDREACVLAKKPKISQRLKELQGKAEKEVLWDRKRSLEKLIKFTETAETYSKPNEVTKMVDSSMINAGIRAIAEINKMLGLNEPEKVDLGSGLKKVNIIFGKPKTNLEQDPAIIGEYTRKTETE